MSRMFISKDAYTAVLNGLEATPEQIQKLQSKYPYSEVIKKNDKFKNDTVVLADTPRESKAGILAEIAGIAVASSTATKPAETAPESADDAASSMLG